MSTTANRLITLIMLLQRQSNQKAAKISVVKNGRGKEVSDVIANEA